MITSVTTGISERSSGLSKNSTFDKMTVKQEPVEDPEIMELAAKMREANKAKMASIQQSQNNSRSVLVRTTGQQSISSYCQKEGTPDKPSDTASELDESSVKGVFGFTPIGDEFIPHICRSDDRYCSVRMVESKLLNKYLHYLPTDIYSCTCIRSYFITKHEANLLNELNNSHCDSQFGKDLFTTKDLVVRLQDAEQFNKFLETCYKKLVLKITNPDDRCGFFRINGESVVPYTVKNTVKYVPLFYFEGETDNLMQKSEVVDGWELSYLKFCCKVQGIKNELFASETCSVVSLDDIKQHFPSGTIFEDWWPSKSFVSPQLNSPQAVTHSQTYNYPTPPSTQVGILPNSDYNSMSTSWSSTNSIRNSYSQNPMPQSNTVTMTPRTNSSNTPVMSGITNSAGAMSSINNAVHKGMGQLPPLVKVQNQNMRPLSGSVQGRMGSSHVNMHANIPAGNNMNRGHYVAGASHKVPPPLLPVNGRATNGPTHNYNQTVETYSSVHNRSNDKTIYPQLQEIPPLRKDVYNIPNVSAYKVSKTKIQEICVTCINHEPYNFDQEKQLMRVGDVVKYFVPDSDEKRCQEALHVLQVPVYKLNYDQMKLLYNVGRVVSTQAVVPMVSVHKVSSFLPQIKYMCSQIDKDQYCPPDKRTKTS